MKRILGIGNALVDIITEIDSNEILDIFSLPKGSMQLVDYEKSLLIRKETGSMKRSFSSGGSAANTIHGLAKLGVSTGFIGSIGKDETGDIFESDMTDAGVKTILFRRDSVTGTAVTLVSHDSERTFATHLGAAVELDVNDLNPDYFKDYNILYLEGYLILNRPLVEKACIIARKNKMKIVLDLASYNVVEAKQNDFKEIINEYVDIVFANEEEAKSFTGHRLPEALQDLAGTCKIAIVKVGKEGSWIRRGDEVLRIDAAEVKSIDTTGAGDLYASGFLYGYSNGFDLGICGLSGTILAGNVIEIAGARMDEARWNNIKNSLKNIIVNKNDLKHL